MCDLCAFSIWPAGMHTHGKKRVPLFHVECAHATYLPAVVIHAPPDMLASDVVAYIRDGDAFDCPTSVMVKSMNDRVARLEFATCTTVSQEKTIRDVFVRARVAFVPPSRGYSALLMEAWAGSLFDFLLWADAAERYQCLEWIADATERLWAAGLAYMDMKAPNILFCGRGGNLRWTFCDYEGAVRAGSAGTCTFPPPGHTTGLDVPATEQNVLWGVGIMVATIFCPHERVMRLAYGHGDVATERDKLLADTHGVPARLLEYAWKAENRSLGGFVKFLTELLQLPDASSTQSSECTRRQSQKAISTPTTQPTTHAMR